MTAANLAYLSQADGETRTPDPFITSEVSCPTEASATPSASPESGEIPAKSVATGEDDGHGATGVDDQNAPGTPLGADFWVYQCYGADDELLYVGITVSGFDRFRGHRSARSPWTRDVARIEIEHRATRQDALERERNLIRERHPTYNIQHAVEVAPDPDGMTIEQVADKLHLSPTTVLRLIRRGELLAEPWGRGWYVTEEAIRDLYDARANRPKRPAT